MKIAYLINQYPKVSHSFVRREIAALEALGVEVKRFSVRAVEEALKDPADQQEKEITEVLLNDKIGLVWSLLGSFFSVPFETASAMQTAIRMGLRSDRGVIRHLAYLAEAAGLKEALLKQGAQHVHAHFGTNSATVALLCRQLGGPSFSFTVHGPEEFDKPDLIQLADKIKASAFVAAISSFGRSQLFRRADSRDWSKVQIVRCGVDDSFLEPQHSPPPSAPRMVCVGRLCEQKGQSLLVQAAAALKARGYDFELVLVGDGEMRAEVEGLIEEHGLQEQIRITGWASGEEVRKELLEARCMVLPSFAEGLPVVIMEALALERPVLSTYVAGIPELVVPGESGWLVPAGSIEALTDAMEAVLKADPETLARHGKAGREAVLARHDASKIAEGLKALFERYHG